MEVHKLREKSLHLQRAITSKTAEYSYGSCTLDISVM